MRMKREMKMTSRSISNRMLDWLYIEFQNTVDIIYILARL
jgi:hypothetical protein